MWSNFSKKNLMWGSTVYQQQWATEIATDIIYLPKAKAILNDRLRRIEQKITQKDSMNLF